MAAVDPRSRPAIRGFPTYRPGTSIQEVKRTLRLSSVIKLASNENALGPSPKALAALRRAVGTLHRYPDATCTELRAAVSRRLRVDPASLVFGNGSDEIIVLALRAFVDPGEHVVVASPTFLIYELQSRVSGADVSVVPLKGFRYDLDAMRRAVTSKTKLIFLANPDNPTGTYVTAQELERFLRGLPPQVIVFSDEAYHELVEARDYPRTLGLFQGHSLIIARSFSKAYGLAGLRVGYGIARPSLIAAMEAVREPFNVNSLAQAAAAAALRDREFLIRTRRMVREGRRYLMSELAALRVRVVPSVTNFLLLDAGPRAQDLARRLLARGIIVREMGAWKLPGCLRVTIGTMPENRRFIRTLQEVIR